MNSDVALRGIPALLSAPLLLCACSAADPAPPLAAARLPGSREMSSRVIQAVEETGSARVILDLKVAPGASPAPVQRAVLSRLGAELRLRHAYSRVPAIAGEISAAGLQRLSGDPDVASVQIDEPGGGHLAESKPYLGAGVASAGFGLTGKGIRLAVLDSGVDLAHPDLAGDVVAQRCFTQSSCAPGGVDEGTSAQDDHGHGTNVTGIITADGVVSQPGFAPQAEIAAVKVLDSKNAGFVSDWVAGLDWVIQSQPTLGVRVVNMSLGTFALYPGNCDADQPSMAAAVAQLSALGVVVFASSGNQGGKSAIASPACNTGVVAVGATYDSEQGRQPASGTFQTYFGGNFGDCFDPAATPEVMACFTNSDSELDLLLPGASLTAPGLGGGVSTFTGTSQASPTAAALAALMLECNPSLGPAAIEMALRGSGPSVTDPGNGLAFPTVYMPSALAAACRCAALAEGAACDDANPCTTGDACQGGLCVGAPAVTCVAEGACHLAGSCDPRTGACTAPPSPEGSPCDDGDPCTTGDACTSGVCAGAGVTCPPVDACHHPGTCHPGNGACLEGAPIACPSADPCRLDGACDPASGKCDYPPAPDGTACDDHDACTRSDVCSKGTCVGEDPVSCAPEQACRARESCDPGTGECVSSSLPNGASCEGGSCRDGACVPEGCSCRAVGDRAGAGEGRAALLAALGLILARRCRRRRARCPEAA